MSIRQRFDIVLVDILSTSIFGRRRYSVDVDISSTFLEIDNVKDRRRFYIRHIDESVGIESTSHRQFISDWLGTSTVALLAAGVCDKVPHCLVFRLDLGRLAAHGPRPDDGHLILPRPRPCARQHPVPGLHAGWRERRERGVLRQVSVASATQPRNQG